MAEEDVEVLVAEEDVEALVAEEDVEALFVLKSWWLKRMLKLS